MVLSGLTFFLKEDERLDEAAETLLKNVGLGLLFGLAPIVVTRRFSVIMGTVGLGLGYAAGVTTRDTQRILNSGPLERLVEEVSAELKD